MKVLHKIDKIQYGQATGTPFPRKQTRTHIERKERMSTPTMTARVTILDACSPEPFDIPSVPETFLETLDTIQQSDREILYFMFEQEPSTDDAHSISSDTEPTEYIERNNTPTDLDACIGDPPTPNEPPIDILVRTMCTMTIREMEEYGDEYEFDFNLVYPLRNQSYSFTHIMLTSEDVWINVHNVFASDTLPRFKVREIKYETCAQYFIDSCFDGDMRYTAYANGTTSYWCRLDLQATYLMRKVLTEWKTSRGTDLYMRPFVEYIGTDLLYAIDEIPPLSEYIKKIFIPMA